ncbi:FkbM family methyltransferase [Phyllobacterium trifolii]|uniref:FkbM family methyltransferase n=1 Tax=Phyllobacterium trifolii TaxID=300193 RepID=A0A839UJ58_9HYPH|nr:FkbM family methyltransferase [Phyllobacterium trifolii]MBB3149945.1 FkbM family methyltransferase [Phyllobacterium trifolii]
MRKLLKQVGRPILDPLRRRLQRLPSSERNGYVEQIDSLESRLSDTEKRLEDVQMRTLFAAAFAKAPAESDLARLSGVDFSNVSAALRTIVTTYDKQTHASPITVRFGASEIETFNMGDYSLVLDKSDNAVSRHILEGNDYEPHLVRYFRRSILPGMTVVDIGANVGFYSMLSASIVGPAGKVLSFEPNTENCRLLLMSAAINAFNWVKLFPLALSDENGTAFFSPAIGSNGGFLPSIQETLMSPNCTVVPTMVLDDMVDIPVHFIKADTEGAEYLALKGGERLLRKHLPIIALEFSMEMSQRVSGIDGGDFLRWLYSMGYSGSVLSRSDASDELITDIDTFISDWGNITRIEDIVFQRTR